ncbi:hypothetical protein CERZMDRAFT_93787 [Cercospora zeae-maydis SCOH1-5]|uniref:Uncharacterized protein n=1 Tax=Cercospora zeae-maydis SCOH1-5 TaxID=717836 RepID=A0A6A6FSQ9_9PEZI|nr:hypothetical protein CERZMDRAFT_93787 [Cercospora zeae-maydis SCOH1-5]
MSQLARLETLLNDLSQRLKHSNDHIEHSEEKRGRSVTPKQDRINGSDWRQRPSTPTQPLAHNESDLAASEARRPLSTLLENAIDKTANLFAIEPPRSPRAESQMSYSLSVNSNYRVHMDKAPERAVELEKDLRAAKMVVRDVAGLVEECKTVAKQVSAEKEAAQNRGDEPATAGRGVNGSGKTIGGHKAPHSLTLEERRNRVDVKSECFL